MKIYNLLPCLVIIFLLMVSTGCKKSPMGLGSGNSNPNTPDTSDIPTPMNTNTPPIAYAGEDVLVWSPLNETELNGSYSDNENNINEVSWAKISGPNSYILGDKKSLYTRISGLEEGAYQFELTVTDEMNLYDKDTMVVTVGEISANPNEIIFKDLVWIFPWYNNVEIKNFVSNIPPGSMFKIFIQRDNDPEWKEVPSETVNGFYDYFIITGPHDFYSSGSLYISYYGSDVDDTPNVKIVY